MLPDGQGVPCPYRKTIAKGCHMALPAIIVFLLVGLAIYVYLAGPKLPPETDAIIDKVFNSDLPNVISGETGYVSSDGIDIWYESISPKGTAKGTVLLIMAIGGDALI